MFLYELALELDEKSLDLSARAAALGLPGAGPNTELTKVQVAALRGNVPIPEVNADGEPIARPVGAAGGDDPSPGGSPGKRPKKGLPKGTGVSPLAIEDLRKPRRKLPIEALVVGVLLLAAAALVTYMAKNMGSIDERKQQLAADNAKVEAQTRAGELGVTSGVGGAKPGKDPASLGVTDVEGFCQSYRATRTWTQDLESIIKRRYAAPGSVNVSGWARGNTAALATATARLESATAGPLHDEVANLAAGLQKQAKVLEAAKTSVAEDKGSEGVMAFLADPKTRATQLDLVVARQVSCG